MPLINVLFSQFFWNSAYAAIKLTEFRVFGWYLSQSIRTLKQIIIVFFLLSIGGFIESLLAIAQFFNHGSINGFFYLLGERFFTAQTPGIANASINGELVLRSYGTFSHPNVLAGFLVLVMSFLLFGFFRVY